MAPAPGTQTAGPEFHVRIASAGRLFLPRHPLEGGRPQQSFGGDVAVFDEFRLDPSSLRALIGLVATP